MLYIRISLIENSSIVPKIFKLFEKRGLLFSLNYEIVLQIVDEDSFIILFYHHNIFTFKKYIAGFIFGMCLTLTGI